MTQPNSEPCCISLDDLCKGYKCEVKEHEQGVCICVSSEDSAKVEALKARMKACCGSERSKSSCC